MLQKMLSVIELLRHWEWSNRRQNFQYQTWRLPLPIPSPAPSHLLLYISAMIVGNQVFLSPYLMSHGVMLSDRYRKRYVIERNARIHLHDHLPCSSLQKAVGSNGAYNLTVHESQQTLCVLLCKFARAFSPFNVPV